jgi:hypothetical protein
LNLSHRFVAVLGVLSLVLSLVAAAGAGEPDKVPGVESSLQRVADSPSARSRVDLGDDLGIVTDGGRVAVRVVASEDTAGAVAAIAAAGGSVSYAGGGVVSAEVPLDSVRALAGDPSIQYIYSPPPPEIDADVTEGVIGHEADLWHAEGLDGTGVNLLVVDSGFDELSQAFASNDLPALAGSMVGSGCGGGLEGGSEHGTAVAEHAYDMAPGVDLYLFRLCSLFDGPDITQFIEDNNIDVVVQSLTFFNTGPLDGSDPFGEMQHIKDVLDDGVVWVNSAGNHRERHWRGTWVDDGGGLLEFDTGDNGLEFTADGSYRVYLRWDDWALSTIDLDLRVYDSGHGQDSSSTSNQTIVSPGPPVERAQGSEDDTMTIEVEWVGGNSPPGDLTIDIFILGSVDDLEHQVPGGSLNDASTIPGVISVGAVSILNGTPEYFSSMGPTADNRMKPDVAGYDRTTSSVYGNNGFAGTSAAAPHIAGVVALMLQASGPVNTEVADLFGPLSIDVAAPGFDNRTGIGLVKMGAPPAGECEGIPATLVALPGQIEILGDNGDNVILGNAEDNIIRGYNGDDIMCGEAGKDILRPGKGNDSAYGGKHADKFVFRQGDDFYKGYGGRDSLYLREADVPTTADLGAKTASVGGDVISLQGLEKVHGSPQDDVYVGSDGDDVLRGLGGDDTLIGAAGDDRLVGGPGNDSGDGGAGTDECKSLEIFSNCE